MEKAYIILAHQNMEQLNRLIKRLDDNSSTFFVHIDKKSPHIDLSSLFWLKNKVHFIKRINTQWAGFSLVQATLNAMQVIKNIKREFGSITLLSGQDYPIKSNEYINDFLRHSEKKILIEYFEMPNYEKWSPGGGMYRLNKYFFGLKEYQLFLSRSVNFLAGNFPFLQRRQPDNLKPYAGSQWWMMDMYALNYILDYIKKNPGYSIFHKATFAPDELFFQTILLNATDERIRKSILNDNKRFVRWQNSSLSHPEFLQRKDVPAMLNSDGLFARKLSLADHPEMFDIIDAFCLSGEMATA